MTGEAQESAGGASPYRSYDIAGWEVLVGKGDRQNDRLTFRIAGPEDLWLHAAGYSGSHVIIRSRAGEAVPREVIEQAAQLAAFHSKARDAGGKVPVHVCRAADVRKPPGAPPGQVQLRSFGTVRVYVDAGKWEEGKGKGERGGERNA